MTEFYPYVILCSEGCSLPRPISGLQTVWRDIIESRIFIRTATTLRKEIADFAKANLSLEETQVQGQALQKDINAAFQGLQNPTLPSAEKLLQEAQAAGFFVNPMVAQRIGQAQHAWLN